MMKLNLAFFFFFFLFFFSLKIKEKLKIKTQLISCSNFQLKIFHNNIRILTPSSIPSGREKLIASNCIYMWSPQLIAIADYEIMIIAIKFICINTSILVIIEKKVPSYYYFII